MQQMRLQLQLYLPKCICMYKELGLRSATMGPAQQQVSLDTHENELSL